MSHASKARIAVALCVLSLGLSACFEPEIQIRIANDTDSTLTFCYTRRGETKTGEEFCDQVSPNDSIAWGLLCHHYDGERMIVAILVEPAEELYNRDAVCTQWDDTTITVSRRGQDYLVTDELSASAQPSSLN